MGSHFCGILRVRKFWQVVIYKRKDSPKKKLPYSLLLFNISQTAPIKGLSWGRENYIYPKVTKMGSIIGHRI